MGTHGVRAGWGTQLVWGHSWFGDTWRQGRLGDTADLRTHRVKPGLGTLLAWGHRRSGQAWGPHCLGDTRGQARLRVTPRLGNMRSQARLRVMPSLGTHGVRPGSGCPLVWGHVVSGQAHGHTQLGVTQGQARLGDPAGLGTHEVRPGSGSHAAWGHRRGQATLRVPLQPPEPPNPPEEVVSDLEVTDGSLHEEAHQGTVQVALVLQGLHRGQRHGVTAAR